MKDGTLFKDGPKEEILNDKNISKLYGTSVAIKKKDGYYYGLRA